MHDGVTPDMLVSQQRNIRVLHEAKIPWKCFEELVRHARDKVLDVELDQKKMLA